MSLLLPETADPAYVPQYLFIGVDGQETHKSRHVMKECKINGATPIMTPSVTDSLSKFCGNVTLYAAKNSCPRGLKAESYRGYEEKTCHTPSNKLRSQKKAVAVRLHHPMKQVQEPPHLNSHNGHVAAQLIHMIALLPALHCEVLIPSRYHGHQTHPIILIRAGNPQISVSYRPIVHLRPGNAEHLCSRSCYPSSVG